LIILVHGLSGGPYDLANIRNNILKDYPNAIVFSSRSNIGKTEGCIFKMGENLS